MLPLSTMMRRSQARLSRQPPAGQAPAPTERRGWQGRQGVSGLQALATCLEGIAEAWAPPAAWRYSWEAAGSNRELLYTSC